MRLSLRPLVFSAVWTLLVSLRAEPNFKFAWPDSAEAQVTENIDQAAGTTQRFYTVRVTRNKADGSYILEHKDPHPPERLQKMLPPGSMMASKLVNAYIAAGKTITYVLDGGGNLKDIPNFQEMKDAKAKFPESSPAGTEKQREQYAEGIRVYSSEYGKRMLWGEATMDWTAWIGIWLKFEAPENGFKETVMDCPIPILGVEAISSKVKCTHLGAPPQNAKLVHARFEMTPDPQQFKTIKELIAAAGKGPGHPPTMDDSEAIMKYSYETDLDPTTSLPYWVKVEAVSISGNGADLKEERRAFCEYVFTWKMK